MKSSTPRALVILCTVLGIVVAGCRTADNQGTKENAPLLQPRQRIVPSSVAFQASALKLIEGDELRIQWNVDINDSLPSIVIRDGDTVAKRGSIGLIPGYGNHTYTLSVRTADTVIDKTLNVEVARKVVVSWTPDDVSTGPDDGRFTIGCRGQRLTYGYPAPLSTSHIVVKVNGTYATNNPGLASIENVPMLKSTSVRAGRIGYNRTEIPFRFYGVDILQRVVPVDRAFNEIADEQDAVYYKMAWTMTNRHTSQVKVGLAYLLDTMIDDNDAARVEADETLVSRETEFTGNRVPSRFLVFRRDTDVTDLTAVFIPAASNTAKPSTVIVGRWPFLHGQLWRASEPGAEYFDSAIMSLWDDIELEPAQSVTLVTFYGTKQLHSLILMDNNQNLKTQVLSINYDKRETQFRQSDIARLKELLADKRVLAASISGFSDAQGDDAENLTVSRQRAERIQSQLLKMGVDRRLIMVKAYGESQALQTAEAEKSGVESDRRVEISLFYE